MRVYSLIFPYRAIVLPPNLNMLAGPRSGIFQQPISVMWQSRVTNLENMAEVRHLYEETLSSGVSVDLMAKVLNKQLLITLWRTLNLPEMPRQVWEAHFPQLRENTMSEDFRIKVQNIILPRIMHLNFALGGGGALKEWVADYRETYDIDAYTDAFARSPFDQAEEELDRIAHEHNWDLTQIAVDDVFRAYEISNGSDTIRLDLGYDYRIEEVEERSAGGLILAFPDVIVGKSRALSERKTSRDILDVAHIINKVGVGFVRCCVDAANPQLWESVETVLDGVRTGGYDRVLLDDGIDPDMVRGYLAS